MRKLSGHLCAAIFREWWHEAGGPSPIPFTHRPITHLRNAPLQPEAACRSNSYILTAGDSIFLVYDDAIVVHEFDDRSTLQTAIGVLQASGTRRIGIGKGVLKIIAVFLVFLAILSLIVRLQA